MTPSRTLKSAAHHWWPRNLSRFWSDASGGVTQVSWNEEILTTRPANFGAITNAHHIKLSEDNPWNATFEPQFGKADTSFSSLVPWLQSLESRASLPRAAMEKRLKSQPLSNERKSEIAAALSSLIVRSPSSRHNIRITVEGIRKRMGFEDHAADDHLIAGNMYAQHSEFTRAIANGGKFVALIAQDSEFIFGDGFLHNFPPKADYPRSARCIVPLLPTLSILFVKPLFYRTYPELVTLGLRQDEVKLLNDIVQVYSCNRIFYRSEKPKLIDEFRRREHLTVSYHSCPWIDELTAAASNFHE